MLKQYFREMKSVWKPATIMYFLCLGISLITGLSMETVVVSMFCFIFLSLILWATYVYLFKK